MVKHTFVIECLYKCRLLGTGGTIWTQLFLAIVLLYLQAVMCGLTQVFVNKLWYFGNSYVTTNTCSSMSTMSFYVTRVTLSCYNRIYVNTVGLYIVVKAQVTVALMVTFRPFLMSTTSFRPH